MLRILQVIDGLLIIPAVCLGFMVGLSGGGMTPAFQQIYPYFIIAYPVSAVVAIGLSWWLARMSIPVLPYIIAIIPLLVLIGLCVWLEIETGFFMIK